MIFVYILQGKMGKTGKNEKKITQLKQPKYKKPKDKNMGWTKQKYNVELVDKSTLDTLNFKTGNAV